MLGMQNVLDQKIEILLILNSLDCKGKFCESNGKIVSYFVDKNYSSANS